jgi:hypothetical protein
MHNIQYKWTILKTLSRGIWQQANGDYPDQVNSDQIVFGTVRQEARPHERQPKALKTKSSKGAIRLKSIQIRWFLW